MKRFNFVGAIILAGVLLIGGCGNTGAKDADGKKDKPVLTTKTEDAGGSIEHGDGYGFSEFDLEIDIDGADAIDIEYDVKGKMETEYENRLLNFHLKDNEAMNAIHELFIVVRITKDMPEVEIIQRIMDFLQVDHYSKFDLDIEFDDGQKLEIKDVK